MPTICRKVYWEKNVIIAEKNNNSTGLYQSIAEHFNTVSQLGAGCKANEQFLSIYICWGAPLVLIDVPQCAQIKCFLYFVFCNKTFSYPCCLLKSICVCVSPLKAKTKTVTSSWTNYKIKKKKWQSDNDQSLIWYDINSLDKIIHIQMLFK